MSDAPKYQILLLDASVHDRKNFDCGQPPLNRYLCEQASQDTKKKVAGCWVLVGRDRPDQLLGFYTLSSEVVEMKELGGSDPKLAKALPRYPRLGAVLLGRLAVAQSAQKQGLGEFLLFDAMHRVLNAPIPTPFIITDPKDKKAEAFYVKYGFKPLNPQRLFITAKQIEVILGKAD